MNARVDERIETDGGGEADVAEHGRTAEGEPTSLDRRLFMQLHAFSGAGDSAAAGGGALGRRTSKASLYEDVNDPAGVALLTLAEDPSSSSPTSAHSSRRRRSPSSCRSRS